ncbi:hypothetical protein [Treponema phagedenis]|uniref:hypothetical protein n=1 Tax=Treponema phagedenis TaxID=162 RepID=UPI00030AC6CE|nr:hypothetical protein [Treponema phagedenis]TYT79778.1 hypothetical protein FS559_12235 [Treponema phagedenis]
MEAINYVGNQNLQMPKDAQIVPGVSGNAMYYPAGKGTAALAGDRNELSVSLWRRWDGIVNRDAERGIFRFKNLYVYFDSKTELLTVELAGVKNMSAIKDDRQQTHWCFVFAKNNFFSVYKNARLLYKIETGNYPIDFSEGFELGGGHTHATFDEIRIYKVVLPQSDINGLYYLVTKGTNIKHLESVVNNNMAGNVASYTPKYLGACATVPPHRTVVITKGEQLGAVDANKGDWVLMTKNAGGWKQGVCYRWEGSRWVNLEPVYNYDQQYQCCLLHLMEIPELKEQTGHFGAILCGALVSQRALIDELVANQAFIKKLVVQQLRIDSDPNSNQDFEAWFDETNGLKILNGGRRVFEIAPNGDVSASAFKVRFGNTTPKETKFIPDCNISQQQLTPTQKIFYNNLEVEKITVNKKFIKKGGGEVICCYYAENRGSRLFYNYANYYIDKEEIIYTIYFKNKTERVDTKTTLKLDEYSKHDEKSDVMAGPNTLPYPSVNDYPVKENGGCAPGYAILKDTLIEPKDLFILNNIPSSDNIENFPKGTLYRDGRDLRII